MFESDPERSAELKQRKLPFEKNKNMLCPLHYPPLLSTPQIGAKVAVLMRRENGTSTARKGTVVGLTPAARRAAAGGARVPQQHAKTTPRWRWEPVDEQDGDGVPRLLNDEEVDYVWWWSLGFQNLVMRELKPAAGP